MQIEEIKDKLKQIVIDRLDVDEDQITPDASFVKGQLVPIRLI